MKTKSGPLLMWILFVGIVAGGLFLLAACPCGTSECCTVDKCCTLVMP